MSDLWQGSFSLDKQLGLKTTAYSQLIAEKMVWLSGMLPYEQCAAVFKEIGERFIPASSIWRQTQDYGERLQICVEQQRQQVSVERIVLPDSRYDHDQRKAVSMDGGMVNIRGEGWRELKVGAVFDVETRLERNPQTRQLEEMAHGVNLHYTAVLGTKDAFTPALWALAVQHELPTAKERAVIGDGAAWIWNVAEDVCPDGRQIVDWFHAVQHLAQAASTLYPDEEDTKSVSSGSEPTKTISTWDVFTKLSPFYINVTSRNWRSILKPTSDECSILRFVKNGFRLAPASLKVA